MVLGESPLAATLARLDAHDPWFTCRFGAQVGDGWVHVAAVLADPSLVGTWLASLVDAETNGHRDVAASYLAGWLGGALAQPVAAALLSEGRAWPIDPAQLDLHRHPDGWFDGLAVRSPTLRVCPDDPHADEPDVEVVADLAALRQLVAGELVAVLAPLFRAIRSSAPFGTRGMWGTVADAIAAATLERVRAGQAALQPAWRQTCEFLDVLAESAGVDFARPTATELIWSGGVTSVLVRGTCCLFHKISGEAPDPCGESYCTTCPFRDDADRRRRWIEWLEDQRLAGDVAAG